MAELRERFGDKLRITLHKGDRGIFDVLAGGTRLFSKHEAGRFPALGEVADAIEELLP